MFTLKNSTAQVLSNILLKKVSSAALENRLKLDIKKNCITTSYSYAISCDQKSVLSSLSISTGLVYLTWWKIFIFLNYQQNIHYTVH